MPQCQFTVFCCFCVSEKLHRKYSWNWTKQKLKSLITSHEDGVQRRAGDGPKASRTYWWRGPGPGRATRGCDRLVHPLTSPFHLYNPLDVKTLGPELFSRKHTASRRHRRCKIGRVQKLFPAPCQRGELMVRCWPPSWEPQEEGMMSTAASFPQYETKV
jgi:hypothetical protein